MILTVDVGNTNITYGVFDGKELKCSFRMMSKSPRTSDEYGITIKNLLAHNGIVPEDLEGIVVVSVVPNIMHSLLGGLERYGGKKPLVVGPGLKTGIKVSTDNPKEIGADRIVDAVAGYEMYGGPILIIDYGTATTYDLVTDGGEFVCGITAPGVRTSAKALWENAAKLPEIEIMKPASILAKNTIASMQAGLMYGQIGQTEYIVKKVQEEAKLSSMKVVATGGLGRVISENTDSIQIYNSTLTLEGLRIIYEKNRG
ncbi:MAG: type III pantothenate kinase [Lachnospiraceae bacterium]|nr:type III pantothenate kinase [Lachnospiraceae bacterium]